MKNALSTRIFVSVSMAESAQIAQGWSDKNSLLYSEAGQTLARARRRRCRAGAQEILRHLRHKHTPKR